MRPILSEIRTFRQHLVTLSRAPEKYKPSNCPYCHSIKLWCHGYYPRKPDRLHIGYYSHNDLSVARFKCTDENCGRTCSTLPECFSPRRWYPWINQQWCLWFLFQVFVGRLIYKSPKVIRIISGIKYYIIWNATTRKRQSASE